LKRGRPKFIDRAYQFDICLWLALGKDNNQIVDLVEEKYKLDMSFQNIDNYRYGEKWKKIISYLRLKYLNNIARIPIAKKAHRLSLLNQAAEECLKWRTKSINQFGTVQEMKIGVLPALIAEARKEVEGEKGILIDESTHTHYTSVVQQIRQVLESNGKPDQNRIASITQPL